MTAVTTEEPTGTGWPLGQTKDAFAPIPGRIARRLRDLDDVDADPSADADWARFVAVLRAAEAEYGRVHPNEVRELLRGQVQAQRISRFYGMAKRQGLLVGPVQIDTSNDRAGRNSGKPIRVYRFQEPTS